jgi:hypothetical protein
VGGGFGDESELVLSVLRSAGNDVILQWQSKIKVGSRHDSTSSEENLRHQL